MRLAIRDRVRRDLRVVNPGIVVVVVTVIAAIAVRGWILGGPLGRVDGDEAVVGLMGLAFAHGHVTAMFWGQNYGGAIEPATTGILFQVLGASRMTLKLVPLLFACGSGLVLWRIARAVLDRRAAAFAGALLLVYPPFSVWWSTKARGIYWAAMFIVLLAVLVGLRYVATAHRRDLLMFGVLAGLAWWTNPQSVFVLAPFGVWLLVRSAARWRELGLLVTAAVMGALPWAWWNAHHAWNSLSLRHRRNHSAYLDRLQLFATRNLPEALGLRTPYSGRWVLGPVGGPLLYSLGLVAFGFALVSLARAESRVRRRWEAVLVVMLVYPFVYAIPAQTSYTGEPRYLQLLMPFVILFACRALVSPGRQLLVLAGAMVLTVSVLGATASTTNREAATKEAHPPDMTRLVRVLRADHVRAVHAGYWIAYPVSFASGQTILADSSGLVRDRAGQVRAARANPSAYVVLRGSESDFRLAAWFTAAHDAFRRTVVARYSVYDVDTRTGRLLQAQVERPRPKADHVPGHNT